MAAEDEEPKRPVTKHPLVSRKVKTWTAVILSILVLILVIQNTQTVEVSIYFWNRPMPLVILILFVFFLGMIVGYVVRRKR